MVNYPASASAPDSVSSGRARGSGSNPKSERLGAAARVNQDTGGPSQMSPLVGWLNSINRRVGRVVRWLAIIMVLVQFIVVLLRYVYGFSSIALNESVLYMHASLFMLGAGYTLLMDDHVRVDVFQAKASDRGKAFIDVFGHVVFLIPSMLALLYWSWQSVRNAWAIYEGPLSVGGIPGVFLLKTLIPTFCILLLIQSLACLLQRLITLTRPARA